MGIASPQTVLRTQHPLLQNDLFAEHFIFVGSFIAREKRCIGEALNKLVFPVRREIFCYEHGYIPLAMFPVILYVVDLHVSLGPRDSGYERNICCSYFDDILVMLYGTSFCDLLKG